MAEFAGTDGNGAAVETGELSSMAPGGAEERVQAGAMMEAAENESDDEEDVFEVESILDSKIEGGEVLYRVRWKGYDADGDTWEPEAHLDDCKEVLLEFKRKQAESRLKAVKREPSPRLPLGDIFEAESESDPKEEEPQKKKKKSKEEEDEFLQEELNKKKSKSGKSKEKSKHEGEPESQPTEHKSKKRLSESKEDLSSKKPKKEDVKESKKSKKEDYKDTKVKVKEDLKEKKPKKSLGPEVYKEETSPAVPEAETVSVCSEAVSEDRDKVGQDEDLRNPDATPPYQAEELDFGGPLEEETNEVKLKKKKKKHKKKNDDFKTMLADMIQQDKKSLVKKQKSVDKVKEVPPAEKLPAPVPKRPSSDDKLRKSVDSLLENKETKKTEMIKEKPKKKHEPEKELKKDVKVVKTLKEQKNVFDAFSVSAEDREECMESIRKEQESFDFRPSVEYKPKEVKTVLKERRPTQEETDSWTFGASEGDQEVMDTVYHVQENSAPPESKAQVPGMAVDLQLEWMTLDDFQRHLDGTDEIIPKDPISISALKEAVKNGDYLTVKYALNSKEEYNLDQEDSSGMTMVMMAAAAGQDDIMRLLIRSGAKINARQKNGTTALMHAAEKNYLTTVSLLLEAGAFVNLQQATGESALMKACKRGNYDISRLLIEQGADCNMLSKHQGNALAFTKQSNNVLLYELLNNHLEKLSRVVEDAIKDYFETRLAVLEPIFPIACHRLCEGPDFSLDFNYKPPYNIPEESGILLFVFHANFFGKEVVVRLSGPCSVQAVVLNDKFQLPVFLDAHFIYSFSPVAGPNKLFIRLSEVPTAKVKLLISAYRVQLH